MDSSHPFIDIIGDFDNLKKTLDDALAEENILDYDCAV